MRTAAEFKFVRKVAGFRANEIAELLGVRPETVSRWERGEAEIPRPGQGCPADTWQLAQGTIAVGQRPGGA